MPDDSEQREVDRFIFDLIDTVPHLEALLQLWKSHPRKWNPADLSKVLYVTIESAQAILHDLVRRRLIVTRDNSFWYEAESNLDTIVGQVDLTYRRELVRVSKMIHGKPSASIREFARAFRFRKEEQQ